MSPELAVLFLCWCGLAAADPAACVFELECPECTPEHMPLVTSHRAAGGTIRVQEGDEVLLACAPGNFLAYPLLGTLGTVCERGRLRVRHDGVLRTLLELGCQENVFEDVLHQVEHCSPPLQGRAYLARAGQARHLATVCFDADRALATRLHASSRAGGQLALRPHEESRAPLSLLGNFNHMFDARTRADAERLFSDDARLNRRLREVLKHEHVSLAGQVLTSAKLLSAHYFEDQNMRVTDFVSNRVLAWTSVASGNLLHLHRDVAALMARAPLDVYTGTHGAAQARTASGARDLYLQPGRFPVPRYIWTVVHEPRTRRALAVLLLNDPFVAVSEIREAVFCESACGGVRWLHELRRHRRYEAPVYGLAFCCSVHNLTRAVPEMAADILRDVPEGESGMLNDILV